jgi:excisionase family DNA binding protein
MELRVATIMAPVASDWMKTDEVAARMGCTRRTVRNRLQRGSIPVRWTFIERTIHVNRAQFLAWLEGGDVEAAVLEAA